MITLALETSTTRGGVALFRDSELVFSESFTADRSHTSQLFAVIERALGAETQPGRIVVGLGPGSYAGVRIAISAAIGLSVASGAELLGVPSIAALADGEYLSIGDARRDAFYFAHVNHGDLLDGPKLLTRPELESRLAGSALPILAPEPIDFPGVKLAQPEVERLGALALSGRGVSARGLLEPIYLREPHITVPKST